MPSIEVLIPDSAVHIAERFKAIASNADSEEDVRHGCNKLIDDFIEDAGIKLAGRHEYVLRGGRIDSKYGAVIIEYKPSKGAKRIGPGTSALVEQLKSRFEQVSTKDGVNIRAIFGVGCDGNQLIFVRWRGQEFQIDGPVEVGPRSVEKLLRALVSVGAQGRSFTPELLHEDFGAEGSGTIAREGVSNLYHAITHTNNAKSKTLFNQWKIHLGEVCGYDLDSGGEKMSKLAKHYGIQGASSAELLFSVHTYYALFMKFLAAEITAPFTALGMSVLKQCSNAQSSDALKDEVAKLEQGGIWAQIGITNFLEGDVFSWYLPSWSSRIADVVRGIVDKLDGYDPATLSVEPEESRDLLKNLYQSLFPRSVRHDLGEYYTPDWLADFVLDELGYDGNPDKRLLDPSCGSGTFLVMALNRVKTWWAEHRHEAGFNEAALLKKVLRNVVGFELNPLAVIAARTNYLLAVRDWLRTASDKEIPVYLCDSVMTPAQYEREEMFQREEGAVLELPTGAGVTLYIPREVATDSSKVAKYAKALEFCIENDYEPDEFLTYCRNQGIPLATPKPHKGLYQQLTKLDQRNRDGIWPRIIKNAFAPLFTERFDVVAGNPPWVNWESLPETYRNSMKPLWQDYGLFTLSGAAGRLGGGKKDISMLFVYVCADHYLKQGGKLGFVITQTVFKTEGAGDGFRRFQFEDADSRTVYVRPTIVHDFSEMQLFTGATNRTAVFVAERSGQGVQYPVNYQSWRGPSRLESNATSQEVKRFVRAIRMSAEPISAEIATSPWLTINPNCNVSIRKAIGPSHYRAQAGSFTGGLNGCFWLEALETLPDSEVLVQNLHDIGKIKVTQYERAIESTYVFPLLRGREVSAWTANCTKSILVVQDPRTGKGFAERALKAECPKTFAYLKLFEGSIDKPKRGTLRGRALFKQYFRPSDPFYSMYNIDEHTFADWKVVWKEMSRPFKAAVVGPKDGKPVVPDHKLMLVPCAGNEDEAHFIAALLNSSPSRLLIDSYVVPTSTSTHVLKHVRVPRFDPNDPDHTALADLSKRCHLAASRESQLSDLEKQVDEAAAKLWEIAGTELVAIQQALNEVLSGAPTDEAEEEDA